MSEDEEHGRDLVEKAEHDLQLVQIGLEHGAFLDTLCFHLQQAAEKLIKALLMRFAEYSDSFAAETAEAAEKRQGRNRGRNPEFLLFFFAFSAISAVSHDLSLCYARFSKLSPH